MASTSVSFVQGTAFSTAKVTSTTVSMSQSPCVGGRPAGRLVCPVRRDRQRTECPTMSTAPGPARRGRSSSTTARATSRSAAVPGQLEGLRGNANHRVGGYWRRTCRARSRSTPASRRPAPAGWHGGGPGIELRGEQRGDQLGPGRAAGLRGRGDRRLAQARCRPRAAAPDSLYTERASTSSGSAFEEDITSGAAGAKAGTATLVKSTDWYAVVAASPPPPPPPARAPTADAGHPGAPTPPPPAPAQPPARLTRPERHGSD